MKYLYLFFCATFISFSGFSQKINVQVQYVTKSNDFDNDTIFYSPQRKLMWSDYKEVDNPSYVAGALTSTNIGYTTDIDDKDGKISMNIQIFAYFQKDGSWRKPNTTSGLLLNHEQLHFDLTYLSALRFVEYIKKAKFKQKNYKKLVNSIYIQTFKENQAIQQAYDQATDYGKNVQAQIEWNKNIADMMDKQVNKGKKDDW